MPLIEYPEDRPALSSFGAVDYRQQESETVDPGIVAELGAAWRQDNIVGSYFNNKMAGIDRSAREDGFSGDVLWSEIQGTPYEQHWERFAEVFNRKAFNALKSQIDMETEDRRTLDAGGWSAVAAQFGMATLDLPTLIPGGAIYRNVQKGVQIGRTALSTAGAGALGAGVSELALQATQETRPLAESAFAVGGGAVLGGLLGGGIGALYSKAERSAALRAVAKAQEPRDDAAVMDEFRAGLVQGQSAGAAAVDLPVLEDYDIAGRGAKAIGAATARLNPLLRAAHSPSAVYRSVMADMAETGFYLEKNVRGEGNLAVESAVKYWDRGALSKGLTDMKAIWAEARKSGLDMTEEGFRTAVSMAMRRGDVGDNEFVSKAAKAWRSALFDPLKEQAVEVGLLPADVSVKTAVSYLTRLWNAPRLVAEEPKFKNIVRPWINDQLAQLEFKADEIRIGNRIIDSDKAREAFDRVDARLAGIEERLSQRQGYRERRTANLEELRQTRDDLLKQRAPKELVDMLRGADETKVMVQAVKEARAGQRSAGRKKSFAERQPVLALVKSKGGVRVGSQLDSALRAMDVTPKTHPGLFVKKGGIGDLDNFVASEDDFLAGLPLDETGMYVDPRELYGAIRSELGGVPLKSADEIAAEDYLDNIDRVASEWLEAVGLADNATVKEVRDFISRVLAAERNTEGMDSRISRLERELETFDQTTDGMLNERDITKAEAKAAREAMDALDAELEQVGDIANTSPRVSLIVDLATTKRTLFKEKLKANALSKRVEAIKRLDAEGGANDDILAELAAKEIELGQARANIEGLKAKADRLEPMMPKVKQEIPEFLSPEDRADYVNSIVDDIFNQLTGRARQGMPSYDMVMAARGPLKERTFSIPDELVEDFLEQDIELIARRYARVMAADVEMARMDKRLGGAGKPDLIAQVDRVTADYQRLRDAVSASPDLDEAAKEKARSELSALEKRDKADLAGVRDLLRGQYKLDSQHTNFARVLNVAMSYNYMRSLGGVLATSVTDAVRPAMVHGLGRYMGQGIAPLVTNLKGFKMAVADAKLMGAVTERVLQSRIATMAELSDPYAQNSPFERFVANLSNTFSKMTLLPWWNDMHKSIASVMIQNRILKNALQAAAERPSTVPAQAPSSGLLGQIRELVASAFKGNEKRTVNLGPVEAKRYTQAGIELDLTGYRHTIDNYAVKHTLKQHGNPAKEAPRGQVAVTREDFDLIPEILSNPDHIEATGKSKIGAETITYSKAFGDTVFYVEEVRTGARELAMKTMFKRGPAQRSDAAGGPSELRPERLQAGPAGNIAPAAPSGNKAGYDGLSADERKYMGFLGIDEFMAERIAKQFHEFGSVEGGVHVPGIESWTDDGARRAFAGALNKDVDGVIVTKGVADVPLFAHTPAGRALLQFRTFALASHQRVLMRGMQEGQARFWAGVVGMSALGMAAYWFKQQESDRPLSTNAGVWIAEGVDRSGIFAIAFEINNFWEKLNGSGFYTLAASAGQALDPSADARQPASRFANRDAFGAFLGPSFQLGTDTAQLLGIPARATGGDIDLTPGDVGRATQMVPFYTLPYWRWFMEGGFNLEEKTGFKGVEPMLKEAVEP